MSSVVVRARVNVNAVEVETSTKSATNSGEWTFVLPGYVHSMVQLAAKEHGLHPPHLLLTVFQEVLRRYTGQKQVIVGFEDGTAGRILTHQGDRSLLELATRCRESTRCSGDADSICGALDGQFSFHDEYHFPDRSRKLTNGSGMHWSMQESAGAFACVLEFEPRIWGRSVVQYFVAAYETLLLAALTELETPMAALDIVSASDVETFDRWNATGGYYPHARVDQLFELRAQERPEARAVSFLNSSMSYAALSEATNQLAAQLRKLGVGPGTLAGVCIERSIDTVVALLAIFKTGAAYLPLDPAFPEDRIHFMLEDAHPLVVITQSRLCERFSFAAEHVLCIDAHTDAMTEAQTVTVVEKLASRASSLDDIAYILYTSGSTGKPKGVQITHRALTNMCTAVLEDVPLDSTDTFLATTTISFDISTFEMFAPLIAGAHVVMAPREVAMNGELLAKAISDSDATLLQATPSGWQVLLEAGWKGKQGLKMLTAGEPLTWILAQRLLDRGSRLWNLYGPTEVTVYCTGREIYKSDAKITVGPALPNYTAYVLDERRQRLPIGAIGELYLGGVGVGAGYLNRPQLTADKFLKDPFSIEADARLYRSGDLARILPNGEFDILGRADNQVKLRGYRIELEEVEAVLDRHPGISKAVARVVTLGDGDQSLVAYVVPRNTQTINDSDWLQHARLSLPRYMVPTAFMLMESFVLTPNGKVDRKALPVFEQTVFVDADAVSEGSELALEGTVLDCWRRILGRPMLGRDQNFFDAGGHSLLVMRMFTEMSNTLDRKLPISCLVEAPTARTFAALLAKTEGKQVRNLVLMQPEGSQPPLYLVHHLLGDVLIYRDLAQCFNATRPVYGIQASMDIINRPQPCSLRDLASEYVTEILEHHPGGPIHLAGFSSGSILAFEMARQLKERGNNVGLLGLIDGALEGQCPAMPAMVKYRKMIARKACKIAFKMRDEVADGPRQFVMKRLRSLWLRLRIRILQNSTGPHEITMEQALLLAERNYSGEAYDGAALLIRFRDEAWIYGPDPLMGWSELVRDGMEVVDLNGGHITGMGPSAPIMGQVLRSYMERFEAGLSV